jgi:hypothetical protein
MSFYCNIFLSQYCASKCLVWIRPWGPENRSQGQSSLHVHILFFLNYLNFIFYDLAWILKIFNIFTQRWMNFELRIGRILGFLFVGTRQIFLNVLDSIDYYDFSGWIRRRKLHSSLAWVQGRRISLWAIRSVFAGQLALWRRKVRFKLWLHVQGT